MQKTAGSPPIEHASHWTNEESKISKNDLLSTLAPVKISEQGVINEKHESLDKERWEVLNKEQKFFSAKDRKEKNRNGEYDEKYISFINGLNEYIKAWGRVVFTGTFNSMIMDMNWGPVKSITIEEDEIMREGDKVFMTIGDKIRVIYTQSPNELITREEELELIKSGKEQTDEIDFKQIFCPDFSFHCKEIK